MSVSQWRHLSQRLIERMAFDQRTDAALFLSVIFYFFY